MHRGGTVAHWKSRANFDKPLLIFRRHAPNLDASSPLASACVCHVDRNSAAVPPVRTLFEYLEGNYNLDEFLECFPSVTREMAHNVLARSEEAFLAPA